MKKVLLLLSFVLLSFTVFAQGTWVTQTSGVTTALQTVSAVDANVCWIGGNAGVVLRTTNGGTTWTNVGAGTDDIYTIWAFDANNCLISTSPGATFVFKTTNGGATWSQVFTQTGGFIDAIKFRSATEGFMYGDPVGGRWSLWKSTDAGSTWDSTGLYLAQNTGEAGWNNALYVNGDRIYFGTNSTRIYYSSNYGASWMDQSTLGSGNIYAIWFNNNTIGMAGATALVKTTNAGTNWSVLSIPGSGNISGIQGYDNKWVVVRQSTSIYASTNDGASWTTAYTSAPGNFFHLAAARNGADAMWAVNSVGLIVKGTGLVVPVELTSFTATSNNNSVTLNWSTATETNNKGFEIQRKSGNSDFITVGYVNGYGTSTSTHNYSFTEAAQPGNYTYRLRQVDFNGGSEFSKAVEVLVNPSSYTMSQNYPNPFNPSTKISFSVAKSGMVKLAVYNLLGQQVQTLVNEVKEAGTHEVSFNASNLTSGVYFYKLETPEFSKTMKMILNK